MVKSKGQSRDDLLKEFYLNNLRIAKLRDRRITMLITTLMFTVGLSLFAVSLPVLNIFGMIMAFMIMVFSLVCDYNCR